MPCAMHRCGGLCMPHRTSKLGGMFLKVFGIRGQGPGTDQSAIPYSSALEVCGSFDHMQDVGQARRTCLP